MRERLDGATVQACRKGNNTNKQTKKEKTNENKTNKQTK